MHSKEEITDPQEAVDYVRKTRKTDGPQPIVKENVRLLQYYEPLIDFVSTLKETFDRARGDPNIISAMSIIERIEPEQEMSILIQVSPSSLASSNRSGGTLKLDFLSEGRNKGFGEDHGVQVLNSKLVNENGIIPSYMAVRPQAVMIIIADFLRSTTNRAYWPHIERILEESKDNLSSKHKGHYDDFWFPKI